MGYQEEMRFVIRNLVYVEDPPWQRRQKVVLITHKYRGSQQFSRVEYSTQIYRFDTRGAKEYLQVLETELAIQSHLEINYPQQSDQ